MVTADKRAHDARPGRVERAVAGGSELLSKMAGGSMALVSPEAGALLGPGVEIAAMALLRRVGATVIGMVSSGAAARVGAAMLVIDADRREREGRGEAPRDDGFSERRGGHRPDSEELLEGVLMQAAASYEQRKVVLLGHLYDGLAYDPTTSAEEGHYLLRLADRLTYRQLVALVVMDNPEHERVLAAASVQREEGTAAPTEVVALELDSLADQGCIGVAPKGGGRVARPDELWGSSRAIDLPLQNLRLTRAGQTLRRLMRLSTIPAEDQSRLVDELASPARYGD